MNKFEICVPCHFGIEAVVKREIYDLGYEITKTEDGRVTFEGDWEAVVRANLCIRTGERILIKLGEFHAEEFEDLFQGIKNIPWENYLKEDSKFWVTKASSVKSKLYAVPTIQSVAKKAMVERMKEAYRKDTFPETGVSFPVRIFMMKDEVLVTLDTTGTPLHKRGYRTYASKAPISETLAAALIKLTPWRKDRILLDPFCGSGTFLIEAAMMAANIAPGLNREFTAETWSHLIPKELWKEVREELREEIDTSVETNLQGYDIDPDMIRIARKNAAQAGVDHMIHFQQRDVADTSHPKKYGFIITNPPYGERLEDRKDLPALYETIGKAYEKLDSWSMYIITSYEDAQRYIGRKADKNRKIYNGMIKTYYYQYMGPKPPKREK
ncbi:MAG: class I SAM-dependent RNA methyltransferase [Lachnospiraceae bacterium]|nr:class I SAM-dependent RNA methyltransferase [Lachnospiraceae bacterium]